MDFNQIAAFMTSSSIVDGWDAVCAINASQLSRFCFAQFIQTGPDTAARRWQLIIADDNSDYWVVDISLAPPLVSFPVAVDPAAGPQCIVSMDVLKGIVMCFDGYTRDVLSVTALQKGQNLITGTVDVTKAFGTVEMGKVLLSLAGGAYSAQLEGIDPRSVLSTRLATAIQTYFLNNAVVYELGLLINDNNIPACLNPTAFDLYCQPNPALTGDGCVLLYIQTNSAGHPQPGPLPVYPIPDTSQTALIISNQVIFNNLFVTGSPSLQNSLTDQFTAFGTRFVGVKDQEGIYATSGSGGTVSLGIVGAGKKEATQIVSVNKNGDTDPACAKLPMDAFTLAPGLPDMAISWKQPTSQEWLKTIPHGRHSTTEWRNISAEIDWTQYAGLEVDSANQISFAIKTPTVSYKPETTDWWKQFVGEFNLPQLVTNSIPHQLEEVLTDYYVPSVDTFSLDNLLFPASHLITLKQAAIPCDLLAVGQVNAPFAIAPLQVTLQAGQTQSFGVDSPGIVYNWEVSGDCQGTIDQHGLYTPPAKITGIFMDTIIATDETNAQNNAYALVLLIPPPPATGLVTSPAAITLTGGQSCRLDAYDPDKSVTVPITASWTWQPHVGQVSQGFNGQWEYIAPPLNEITPSQTVTLTATGKEDKAKTGITIVTLAVSDTVTVKASLDTVNPGDSVKLCALSDKVSDFAWLVYPMGQGTVKPVSVNPAQAVYTAPTAVPGNPTTSIVAYSVGKEGMGVNGRVGVGAVTITIATTNEPPL